jgi:hypothetical protein
VILLYESTIMNFHIGGGRGGVPWFQGAVDSVVHAVTDVAENIGRQLHPPGRAAEAGTGTGTAQGQGRRGRGRGPFATATAPQQPPPESSRPAPPASARAIRQLPMIRVAPEDLVEPCNRECCICLEEYVFLIVFKISTPFFLEQKVV